MENISTLEEPLWVAVEYAFIFFLLIYIAFAVIVVRQTKLMVKTLEVGFERQFVVASYLHLGLSLFVMFIAVITFLLT
jgi:hypothetical protein